MKQKWFGLTALLFVLFFTSCYYTPRPIFRLIPEDPETTWLMGKQYLKQTQNGLTIAIAFEKFTYPHFILDVCVSNLDSQTVLIEPEKFYYIADDSSNHENQKYVYAADPELKLLEVDMQNSMENTRYSKSTDLFVLSTFLGLLSDISSIGESKTEEEIEEERCLDEENLDDQEENEIHHKERIADLNSIRSVWEVGALRKTTLKQNYQIRGKVYFPSNDYINWLKISFPLGDTRFDFIFNQEAIPVN